MDDIQRIDFLRAEIEKHNYNYYVLDAPTISDYEFDLLYKALENTESTSQAILTHVPTKPVGSGMNRLLFHAESRM